jgi:hypothetical protein
VCSVKITFVLAIKRSILLEKSITTILACKYEFCVGTFLFNNNICKVLIILCTLGRNKLQRYRRQGEGSTARRLQPRHSHNSVQCPNCNLNKNTPTYFISFLCLLLFSFDNIRYFDKTSFTFLRF